ncbi:MAG: NLP/P60 hydrolase, partial [Paracoccus sp. (in: a-proteobacteria)]
GGIDCSGLGQAALWAGGRPGPGDRVLQRAAGVAVEGEHRPRDLLYWPGHLAMVIEGGRTVHANGHAIAGTIEGIEAAKARIEAAGEGPCLGARRFERPA